MPGSGIGCFVRRPGPIENVRPFACPHAIGKGAPRHRVVGADTCTPLAIAAFAVLPGDADIVAAAAPLR